MPLKVWVIGGTSGIGEAVHAYLIDRGIADEACATGAEDVDVRDIGKISRFYREAGGFDAVVYSAGINALSWIHSLQASEAANIYNVNVLGFMRLLSVIVNGNNAHLGNFCSSVVAVSSDAATRPMRTSMAYCASKAALDMAVKCAARELAPTIRVNAVSPGMTAGTEMTRYIDERVPRLRGWTDSHARDYEALQSPIGRRIIPSEVAEAVCNVLLGPAAMTGSIITVNGGR
jgi:NAD(P)-dependent dehydrogenase (short-subunit alcohol dehydrogenase family)